MGESRSFRNNTSSRIKNQLKIFELRARKIQKERVAIVYLGMNERGSNSLSSSEVDGIYDSMKVSNREEARFIYRGNMIRHSK